MKMHIVFDTEDRDGMAATIRIIDHLAEQYMGRHSSRYDRSFGKIAFIKTLRAFAKQIQKEFDLEKGNFEKLTYAKEFADKVFNDEII
jgi:Flp pilus assembly CpaE family ATPase|tara:strand:+ start:72 stop:335 length:264 start_codon:yes stop_codon:yes gene_type:complete